MHYFKRLTLFTVLTAFLLNTAVADYALALAPASRFDNMQGLQHQDMARIEMALEAQLANSEVRSEDGTIDILKLTRLANQYRDSMFKTHVGFARSLQLFTSEAAELTSGWYTVMCRVADRDRHSGAGVRTYYAVFPDHTDGDNGFPIEVYTEKEWKDNGVEAYVKFKKLIPQRMAANPEDVRIKNEYKNNNEKIVADSIRRQLAAGNFTEIENRAKLLKWDMDYPNRIRPKTYMPESALEELRTSVDKVLGIFGTSFDEVFKGKNLVVIKVPKGVALPVINIAGQEVPVSSRSSNNAVYFFTTSGNISIYDIMHEAGVICGLPVRTVAGRTINDMDEAFLMYRDMTIQATIAYTKKVVWENLSKAYPQLVGIKPVNLDVLRGTNAFGQEYERDYASGGTDSSSQMDDGMERRLWLALAKTMNAHGMSATTLVPLYKQVRLQISGKFGAKTHVMISILNMMATLASHNINPTEFLTSVGGLDLDKYETPFLFTEALDVVKHSIIAAHPAENNDLLSRISVSETEDEMGRIAAASILQDIEATILRKGSAVILFASAPSQHSTWKHLIEAWKGMSSARQKYFGSRIIAFHMDEYIGLPENAEQLFGRVLRERVFAQLGIKAENAHYFNDRLGYETARELRQALVANDIAKADQLTAKLESELKMHMEEMAQKFAQYGGAFDIVIGGIGKLPHLAFNDPPEAKFNDKQAIKIVRLTQTSRQQQVDDGEFARIADVPTHAITFSLPPILQGKRIHIMVPRAFKAEAVRQSLDMPVDEARPASGLRLFDVLPNVRIYLDKNSAALSKVAQSAIRLTPAQEIENITAIAGKAGLEIPTAMEDRYTLLLTSEFFTGDELAEQRIEYADRFNLNTVSGATPQQFIDNVLAKAKGIKNKTVVLVPTDLEEEDLTRLTSAGIRLIRVSRTQLSDVRNAKEEYRRLFQTDTYAIMLLTRRIDANTEAGSSIYQALRFYIRTHFKLDNIAADEYIDALKKNEVAKMILGYLSYRPAKRYDVPDYNNVAVALISA